jgi:hypothetical protein
MARLAVQEGEKFMTQSDILVLIGLALQTENVVLANACFGLLWQCIDHGNKIAFSAR